MFYSDGVENTRKLFFLSWKKYREKQALLPLEQQIVDVVIVHPEYHDILANPTQEKIERFAQGEERNPFLHMGLHLAVREQITTNRPMGIAHIYQMLLQKHRDPLHVEHMMMNDLAKCLWQAQYQHCIPDENKYIDNLTKLL